MLQTLDHMHLLAFTGLGRTELDQQTKITVFVYTSFSARAFLSSCFLSCQHSYVLRILTQLFTLSSEQHYVGLVLCRQEETQPSQDSIYGFYNERKSDMVLYNQKWQPFVTRVCLVRSAHLRNKY